MIFAIVFLIWLASASALPHLLFPAVAIILRSAYMERTLPRVNAFIAVMWLMMAALTALVPSQGVHGAVLLLGRVGLSAALLLHVAARLRRSRLKHFAVLRELWFFGSRALIIQRERLRDIGYWVRVRSKRTGSFGGKLRYYLHGGKAFFVDLLKLQRRINLVVESRGDFPRQLTWLYGEDVGRGWLSITAADLVLFGLMLSPMFIGIADLVPPAFSTFFVRR